MGTVPCSRPSRFSFRVLGYGLCWWKLDVEVESSDEANRDDET